MTKIGGSIPSNVTELVEHMNDPKNADAIKNHPRRYTRAIGAHSATSQFDNLKKIFGEKASGGKTFDSVSHEMATNRHITPMIALTVGGLAVGGVTTDVYKSRKQRKKLDAQPPIAAGALANGGSSSSAQQQMIPSNSGNLPTY